MFLTMFVLSLELVLKVFQSLHLSDDRHQETKGPNLFITQPVEPLKNHVVQIYQAKTLTQ